MDLIEKYDGWFAEGESLLDLARSLYAWASVDTPEDLDHLEDLLHSVEGPPEPDWEDMAALEAGGASEYWTIEAIFEDL